MQEERVVYEEPLLYSEAEKKVVDISLESEDCTTTVCESIEMPLVGDDPVPPLSWSMGTMNRRLLVVALIVKIGLVMSAFLGLIYFWSSLPGIFTEWLTKFLTLAQDLGNWSCIYFVIGYALFTTISVPTEILNISAGLLYREIYGSHKGYVVALFCSMVGILSGAVLCFSISRYLLHGYFRQKVHDYPFLQAVNMAVTDGGFKFILLMRLSPIIPFTMVNYVLGLTDITIVDLVVGSLGSLPLVSAFVYIGMGLHDLDSVIKHGVKLSGMHFALISLGILTGAAALAYITTLTRRRLRDAYARIAEQNSVLV